MLVNLWLLPLVSVVPTAEDERGEFVLLSSNLRSGEPSGYENLAVVNGILVFKDMYFSYNMMSLQESYFI